MENILNGYLNRRKELEEKLSKARKDLAGRLEGVNADIDLSPEGKAKTANEWKQKYEEARTSIMNDIKTLTEDYHKRLQAAAVGITDAASYRQALLQVEGIETAEKAGRILERLHVANDKNGVIAVYQAARDKGWSKVVERFNELDPEKAQGLELLSEFESEFVPGKQSREARLAESMSLSAARTAE
jgi:hypothetical protein